MIARFCTFLSARGHSVRACFSVTSEMERRWSHGPVGVWSASEGRALKLVTNRSGTLVIFC